MSASEAVIEVAGGAYAASLNHYDAGGNYMVTTQQVDEWVYVVGQDDFVVARRSVDDWCGPDSLEVVQEIDCFDGEGAWEMMRHLREGCLVWQCRACYAWIFTSIARRSAYCAARRAVTAVSTSATPGRHVGADE